MEVGQSVTPDSQFLYTGTKIRKNDFAPSEKYSCYAPAFRTEDVSPRIRTDEVSDWNRHPALSLIFFKSVFRVLFWKVRSRMVYMSQWKWPPPPHSKSSLGDTFTIIWRNHFADEWGGPARFHPLTPYKKLKDPGRYSHWKVVRGCDVVMTSGHDPLFRPVGAPQSTNLPSMRRSCTPHFLYCFFSLVLAKISALKTQISFTRPPPLFSRKIRSL